LVPGEGWVARWDSFYDRMGHWLEVAQSGGISSDTLPFILLVVALTWLSAYLFAWSVFCWHSPWLGLLPGGAALFANFTFSNQSPLLAVLYVGGALMLIMRLSLTRRLQAWRREGVPYPEFLSLSFAHLTGWAVCLLLLLAWLMPAGTDAGPLASVWGALARPFESVSEDVVRLVGPIKTSRPLPIHGFGSILPFQGSIKLRDRPVVSVRLEEASGVASYPFLRGAVYDEYTSGGWKAGDREEVPRPPLNVDEADQQLLLGPYSRLVVARIQVADSKVARSLLFSIGEPVGADVDARAHLTSDAVGADIAFLEPARRLEPGATYAVVGAVADASADELRAARGVYPSWIEERYLQLPDDLPQRVLSLAGEVTAASDNPYDKAKAIEAYLRQIPVDYQLPGIPPGHDTIDYFLFDAQQGYFDYHASAMVVLLRAVGVPSRLAVGYLLDPSAFDADSRQYDLRELHAYAWPEVHFPAIGWVPFNPTPDRPALMRAGDPGEGSSWYSIDPSILGSLGELGSLPGVPSGSGPEGPPLPAARGGGSYPIVLWVLAGLAAAAVALGIGSRLAWERNLAGLPYPQRIWEQTVRLATWARLAPQEHQTPREYARQLERRLAGVEGVNTLAEAYGRSRFGRKPFAEAEASQLHGVWKRVRNRLLVRLISWR
ncbi:MAG: transglutaminase domain-containing protein, partial [Chloroflexota bacterium]|nr:transglutaminase domain-containing protein [Chloroflexota bacterium]